MADDGGRLSSRNHSRSGHGTGQLIPFEGTRPAGPRAKPGIEVSLSVGFTVNLVRRTAVGETGPADKGQWLQRCRISSAGLRAGGVREPSDGWGSPPSQHRGWLSLHSLTASAIPTALPPSERGHGSGGAGDGDGLRTRAASSASGRGHSVHDDEHKDNQRLPWLVCRAASEGRRGEGAPLRGVSLPQGMGNGVSGRDVQGGHGGRSSAAPAPRFLDVKVAGRAGGAGGTGSCASLLVRVGTVEAWALGGAATRWIERLGPRVSTVA